MMLLRLSQLSFDIAGFQPARNPQPATRPNPTAHLGCRFVNVGFSLLKLVRTVAWRRTDGILT